MTTFGAVLSTSDSAKDDGHKLEGIDYERLVWNEAIEAAAARVMKIDDTWDEPDLMTIERVILSLKK